MQRWWLTGAVGVGTALALVLGVSFAGAWSSPVPAVTDGPTETPALTAPMSTTHDATGDTSADVDEDTADSGGPAADPYDVSPEIKDAARRFVEAAGTWQPSDPSDAAARLAAAGYPADLAGVTGPLVAPEAAAATTVVIYPQYGGLTATTASVMVLARQELDLGRTSRSREVLLDVRLERSPGGLWQVTSRIDPPRPPLADGRPGGPSTQGAAVLADPQVRLPEPARADVVERRVGDPILDVVTELSRTWELDVQVFATGHPGTVFPTTRVSNHTVGRAADVRAIDGRPVATIPRDDPVLAEFMAAAGRAGATEVGGPVLPAGTGFFTDDVHQDHFHLGITPTKPAAVPA